MSKTDVLSCFTQQMKHQGYITTMVMTAKNSREVCTVSVFTSNYFKIWCRKGEDCQHSCSHFSSIKINHQLPAPQNILLPKVQQKIVFILTLKLLCAFSKTVDPKGKTINAKRSAYQFHAPYQITCVQRGANGHRHLVSYSIACISKLQFIHKRIFGVSNTIGETR